MQEHAMKQSLVVGGTGILAPLTPWLIEQGYWVTVIGQSSEKLANVVRQAKTSRYLTPLALDYHDRARLRKWIEHVQLMQGPLDLVVSWIHEPKEPVLTAIFDEIAAYRHDSWRLIDVIGSFGPSTVQLPGPCHTQRVILQDARRPDRAGGIMPADIISATKLAVRTPEQSVIYVPGSSLSRPN
ncbi:MAG TPA: hypothetical protein DD856_03350 [Sulfobacillus sp.]|nr:hypothetical protein [Sulfobacillus sp.]